MTLRPIKRRHLFEEIILAIEQYIIQEKIKPGEKLPSENEFAERFQVSKTVVREALSVLRANGIIEKRSGAGTFLKDPNVNVISMKIASNLMDKDQLQQLMEFRLGIEVAAVRLAVRNASDEDIEAMKRAHERLVHAYERGSIGIEEDFQFHLHIMKATKNIFYIHTFQSFADVFEGGLRLSKLQTAKLPHRKKEVNEEHFNIIKGLVERDEEQAALAMKHHLLNTDKKIWMHLVL
mgnify:FL=1